MLPITFSYLFHHTEEHFYIKNLQCAQLFGFKASSHSNNSLTYFALYNISDRVLRLLWFYG